MRAPRRGPYHPYVAQSGEEAPPRVRGVLLAEAGSNRADGSGWKCDSIPKGTFRQFMTRAHHSQALFLVQASYSFISDMGLDSPCTISLPFLLAPASSVFACLF